MNRVNILAVALLTLFGALAATGMWNDSANYDERIHLPAGYSYLVRKDMRLNPEHPPLVKDLAALPLLFMKINFPEQSWGWDTPLTADSSRTPSWQTDVGFGNDLLYYSSNDAQNMMRYGRIPIILIGILLGFYIFKFTKEQWGNSAGIIALAFYSLSPTFLAHTRLVTTDVAVAAAFFISFYYFHKWLKLSTWLNLLISGIVLGLGLLVKFSTFLLIPIFGLIVLFRGFRKYLGGFILILIVAFLIIGAVYAYHVWNYPAEKQVVDTTFILSTFKFKPLADLSVWISSQPYLRAWGQYFLGFLMVLQRSGGGNTTYFLGEVSADGSSIYFPLLFLIKEPLPFILLIFFALFLAIKKGASSVERGMLLVIFVYWFFSVTSNLNIGVRHILPTIPFIYVLTARQISDWIKDNVKKGLLISAFFAWAFISVVSVWPSFLTYFNELAGGANGGYRFAVDSNLDWGQDVLRLSWFIEKNDIREIKLDLFSGAPAEYYIKIARIIPFNREIPQKGWLAVSASVLQGACKGGKIPCSYNERSYIWLNQYKPVPKIHYSIFVYKID